MADFVEIDRDDFPSFQSPGQREAQHVPLPTVLEQERLKLLMHPCPRRLGRLPSGVVATPHPGTWDDQDLDAVRRLLPLWVFLAAARAI